MDRDNVERIIPILSGELDLPNNKKTIVFKCAGCNKTFRHTFSSLFVELYIIRY